VKTRAERLSEEIERDGLTITLPQYGLPEDVYALRDLLQSEVSAPFEFVVLSMSRRNINLLRDLFPNCTVTFPGGLKFTSEGGRRAQTEARRYVYRMVQAMLEHELTDSEGWVFGGIQQEPDERKLKRAVRDVMNEMGCKAAR
jgi:hypothetical protein